jgi:hypothetical protein
VGLLGEAPHCEPIVVFPEIGTWRYCILVESKLPRQEELILSLGPACLALMGYPSRVPMTRISLLSVYIMLILTRISDAGRVPTVLWRQFRDGELMC